MAKNKQKKKEPVMDTSAEEAVKAEEAKILEEEVVESAEEAEAELSEDQEPAELSEDQEPPEDEEPAELSEDEEPPEDEEDEEPSEDEEPAEVEEVTTVLSLTEVKALINDNSVSAIDTLRKISVAAVPMIKTVAAMILDYEDEVGKEATIKDSKYIISKNYNLYLLLRNITETKDKDLFNVKFDIVNLAFKELTESSLNVVRLHAHDYEWTYGDAQLTTFQKLVTLIGLQCDKANANINKAKFDINSVMDGTDLTEVSKTNLVSYYKM